MKFRILNIFILTISLLSCTPTDIRNPDYLNGDRERENFSSFIYEIFNQAKVITVKSVPLYYELPGTAALRFSIEDEWMFSVSFSCYTDSCKYSGTSLKEYFSSGLKLTNTCPKPYRVLITLEGDSEERNIYISSSGSCFVLENISYFTEQTFFDVAPSSELNPSFFQK